MVVLIRFLVLISLFLVFHPGDGFRRARFPCRRHCIQCSSKADLIVSDVQEFLERESIATLVPKEQFLSCVHSAQSNDAFWQQIEGKFNQLWDDYDAKIRSEDRKISDIIGENTTRNLLNNIEKVDVYDPAAVKAFLQSQAIEQMIGGILYEGIFEFIQRVDIIGGVVNNLPVIGPIRQQIVAEFKKNIDRVLGSQVKEFLGTFNRIAVQRMISFVLSQENRQSLAKANKNLIASILRRPISSLLPSSSTSEKLKMEIWLSLKNLSEEDTTQLVDTFYDYVGNKKVKEMVDIEEIREVIPVANDIAVNVVNRFLDFRSVKNKAS